MTALPLAGVKVLDLSRVLAGPWTTMTLADLGAEVWKVENPVEGDESRTWKPPARDDTSTYYLSANRSKKSVTIDFRSVAGQKIVRELAARADVVVENYLSGTLARYGLDDATLRSINPRLIFCSISGYGRTGAFAGRAGYDFIIQAESGLMSINGDRDGTPQKFGVAISDLTAGMSATQAILAGLYSRERTGAGTTIDIALLDASISLLSNVASASLNAGAKAKRHGNEHPSIVPYQTFEAQDAPFVLACANNRQFRDMCQSVIGHPELASDERFATNPLRVANRGELIAFLSKIFSTRACDDILAACCAANVPAGRVRTVEEALASPEVAERHMILDLDDGVRVTNTPFHFWPRPYRETLPAPSLGENTDEILRDVLGYDDERLRALRRDGVVA
jgi:crotonobetainyl-CoA:carnitine CoA-transferase CaiB-like acyl-CoA transferase